MRANQFIRNLMYCAVVFAAGWSAESALAWNRLFTFDRVEADPNKQYLLTEENGPWMILACTFSGPNAEQDAHELVLELRKRYKLNAYMYRKTFKFDVGNDSARPVKYQIGDELTEYAVLVGDFTAIDDPEAQETLKKIKYYRPKCLELTEGKSTSRNFAALRYIQQTLLSDENEKKAKGPMGHAFMTTNPLLPDEYFRPNGLDEFLVKLNDGYEYNLLNCPGKYSVMVAHFTGDVVWDQNKIRAIEEGRDSTKGTLAEAAMKAHQLTVALREKGYEAWEFHDRHASLVAIGSFDSVGTKRPDGTVELDPRIYKIMKTFAAEPGSSVPGMPSIGYIPKRLLGIPFDIQPMPIEVPKRSFAADYVRQ